MDRNFACFWPQIFWRRAPEFWKLGYKIGPVSNHVAKFHGDRPRDLGDYALEKKETSRASPLLRTGGLITENGGSRVVLSSQPGIKQLGDEKRTDDLLALAEQRVSLSNRRNTNLTQCDLTSTYLGCCHNIGVTALPLSRISKSSQSGYQQNYQSVLATARPAIDYSDCVTQKSA